MRWFVNCASLLLRHPLRYPLDLSFSLHAWHDNTTAIGAIRRGGSPSWSVNSAIASVLSACRQLWGSRILFLSFGYIRSALNPADAPSRSFFFHVEELWEQVLTHLQGLGLAITKGGVTEVEVDPHASGAGAGVTSDHQYQPPSEAVAWWMSSSDL